jgi:FkbM family methyltransferase
MTNRPAADRLLDRLRLLTPGPAKAAIVRVLVSVPVDRCVRKLFKNGVPHHGARIPLDSISSSGTAARLLFGLYERAETYAVGHFLPPDFDVIELGASLGVITCLIAGRVRPPKRIIALEANPDLAHRARKVVEFNGFHNVTIVPKALAYGSSSVAFCPGDQLSGRLGEGPEAIEVPAVTLADVVRTEQLDRFVLVADIEGAEIAMLINEDKVLLNCQMLIIEMDGGFYEGRRYCADDVEALILSHGFNRIYRHGPVAAFGRR